MNRRFLALFLAGAAAAGLLLALSSCIRDPALTGGPSDGPTDGPSDGPSDGLSDVPSGEVVAFSVVSNAADSKDCYSFRLRNTGEEVLFSCSEDDGEGRVEFEDVSVPPAFMEQFNRLLMDTHVDLIAADAAGKNGPSAPDKPSWTVSVTWDTGAERTMYEKPPEEAAIRDFFSRSARAWGIPEDEAGELKYFYVSASASWIEGSFSFDILEEDGGYLFSAYFIDVMYIEDGNWEEHTVEVEERPLSDDRMEEIRQAARESGLYESLAYTAARWIPPAEDDEELMPLDATTYHIAAGWEKQSFSDSGWGDPHYEPLLSVLKETARALEP